jgi:hypothetical protein
MQDLAAVVIERIWDGLKVKKEIDWNFGKLLRSVATPSLARIPSSGRHQDSKTPKFKQYV